MTPQPVAGRGRIRWMRVIAGICVIVFLGLPCLGGAIVVSIAGNYHLRNSAVSDGRAPGTLRFQARDVRYTVALSAKPDGFFDGLSRTERRRKFRVRDSDANQARCAVRHPDGSTTRLRGDRQTFSETFGTSYATVGEFDGKPGTTTVQCRFDPPEDLLGTPTETPLMVHETDASLRFLQIGLFLGVFVFAGLGTLLILWGTVWRRPAR